MVQIQTCFTNCQGIPNLISTCIVNPDNITCHGIGHILTTFRHKLSNIRQFSPLPVRGRLTLMPRSNSPDTIRTKAIRSRWRGSMLAWILKTKPEKSLSYIHNFTVCFLVTMWFWSKLEEGFKEGLHTKVCQGWTEKTGVNSPARIASSENSFPASFKSSMSSLTCS